MSFLSLDDGFADHPKITRLSHQAFRLHLTALLYCARNLTDGHVSSTGVKVVAATASVRPGRYLPELEHADLWTPDLHGDGYWIHDYLKYNRSATEIKHKKEQARDAARARWRDASRNTPRNAERTASSSVSPPSLSLNPLALAKSPSLATRGTNLTIRGTGGQHQEQGGQPFDKLHRAVGGTEEALTKLRRTWARPTEAAVVAALEACTGPGVRDPLAVALAELKKQKLALQ